jgi:hypothetical protein
MQDKYPRKPEREIAPSKVEILTGENDEVRDIKENSLNLNYLDQANNTFFCEASCITPLDEQNKFTEGLFDCVSLIILAKRNGRPVSFISHFNPKTIRDENERLSVNEKADYFEKWLQDYLSGISQSLDPGSVNSYLAGGKEEKRYLEFGEDSPLAVLSGKDGYAYLKRILTSVSYEVYRSSPLCLTKYTDHHLKSLLIQQQFLEAVMKKMILVSTLIHKSKKYISFVLPLFLKSLQKLQCRGN